MARTPYLEPPSLPPCIASVSYSGCHHRFLLGERVETSRDEESGHLKTLQFLLMHAAVGKQELTAFHAGKALVNHSMGGSLVFPVSDEAFFVVIELLSCTIPASPTRSLSRCPEKLLIASITSSSEYSISSS